MLVTPPLISKVIRGLSKVSNDLQCKQAVQTNTNQCLQACKLDFLRENNV